MSGQMNKEQAEAYVQEMIEAGLSVEEIRSTLMRQGFSLPAIDEITVPHLTRHLSGKSRSQVIFCAIVLAAIIALSGFYLYGQHLNRELALRRMEQGSPHIRLDNGEVFVVGTFQEYSFLLHIVKALGITFLVGVIRLFSTRRRLRQLRMLPVPASP